MSERAGVASSTDEAYGLCTVTGAREVLARLRKCQAEFMLSGTR